jgi:hypothetical protein
LFDQQESIAVPEDSRALLDELELTQWEGLSWQRVSGLTAASPDEPSGYEIALRETAPESGSFTLFSLRRRDLSKLKAGAERRRR